MCLVFCFGLYYNEILKQCVQKNNPDKEDYDVRKQRNQKIPRWKTGRIWMVLLVLWVILIYGHSLTPADLSSIESGWVMECVIKAVGVLGSDGSWVTGHLVRKSAHFFEYCVFGLLLIQNVHCTWQSSGLTMGRGRKSSREKVFLLMLAVLAVPFCDETIQLFVSGRAGQIADVWLDMSGALCGIFLREAAVFLFTYLTGGSNRRHQGW